MTDAVPTPAPALSPVRAAAEKRLKKRHAAEMRFRAYGITAIALAVGFLAFLLANLTFRCLA